MITVLNNVQVGDSAEISIVVIGSATNITFNSIDLGICPARVKSKELTVTVMQDVPEDGIAVLHLGVKIAPGILRALFWTRQSNRLEGRMLLKKEKNKGGVEHYWFQLQDILDVED